jgi:hypothetical protein
MTTTILGVRLNRRMESAIKFQEVLSHHGCSIKTRIGLHEASEDVCSPSGVILLEVLGNDTKKLEDEILAIQDAEIQKMVF